jgi:CubicO group peptidase (beta-lactamase class C family)
MTSTRLGTDALAHQDQRFARAFAVLEDGIAQRAFPGAAVSIVLRGELVALKGLGRFTYDAASPAVAPDTIFDLASVTKVVATTPAAMLLYERGELDLDASVASLLPEFDTGEERRRSVTVRMLLAHSSGLPGYVKLWQKVGVETGHARSPHGEHRAAVVGAAMRVPLDAEPGTRAEYSDIGFIILGEILERIAGEPLDNFCAREVFGPLGMARTGFRPRESLRPTIPPTEDDRILRHRVIQGEVQDENAWVMGGVASHAGVFSPAEDVARFAQCMLAGGAPILRRDTIDLFTRRETSPPGTSRALGWDTPSSPSQSGQHFSPRSFGHLGYAGTSLWIDPERQLAVTLLTNRTWPDRKSQEIRQIRPRFHDVVVEAVR